MAGKAHGYCVIQFVCFPFVLPAKKKPPGKPAVFANTQKTD
jgi:hypothetical protein